MIPRDGDINSESVNYTDVALYEQITAIISEIGEKKVIDSEVISKTTLWRWKTSVNRKTPNPSLVLSLLKKHSGLKSINLIASYYGGVIEYFLKKSFPVAFEEAKKREIESNAGLLKDEYDFHIYFMCSNDRGVTIDEVVYTLGSIAIQKACIDEELINEELINSMGSIARPKIERLIALDIIHFEGKHLKCTKTNPYIEEKYGLKQSLNLLNNIINSEGWSSGRSVFYLSSEAVEEDIAIKASSMLKNCFLDVLKMLENNKSNSESAQPFVFCVAGEKLVVGSKHTKREHH